ncbi:DNA-binding domain-containing protein [Marinomonas balearica]|uniref:Putative DNA-binding protein n=1 Tax=Marinomonas balearica TaxID=491947 RepID=A0A4V3CGD0_9GAMM|nr:DNA-binding domain-containing protein [Marinomonas balearica]TDO97272.1 putative DNA-binding protein [Marinomonas balearica]
MNQPSFVESLLNNQETVVNELAGDPEENQARFNVYRNNVFSSLIDALADIFSVSRQLVGDDFFRAMARVYIADNPPQSPILNRYGDAFPEFISTFVPAKNVPYLSELANLERNLLSLTHCPEYPTLSLDQARERLSCIQDPARLTLALPKTAHICRYNFAVGSIWWAHQPKSLFQLASTEIEMPENVLFVKAHLYGQCFVLSEDEAFFLNALMSGKRFEESIPDSEKFDLGASLAKFMEWQIFEVIHES